MRLLPSHTPLQAVPSPEQAGLAPWGAPLVGVHVPTLPTLSHASHWPPQAPSQQTPSTQIPDWHWRVSEHAFPFGYLVMHVVPLHQAVPSQWESCEQLVPQEEDPEQEPGAHSEA